MCAAPAFSTGLSGITYSCPTSESSLCTSLSTVAAVYSSVFSNADASIYVETGSIGNDLGESNFYWNPVTYSTYLSALSHPGDTVQTDAYNSLSSTEPSLYGSSDVFLTAALEESLGISTSAIGYSINTQNGSIDGTCTSIGSTSGNDGCYSGYIELSNSVTYYTTTPQSTEYDLYSVVEHETDEVLGTSSCVVTTNPNNNGQLADGCGTNAPSAVDLFRYNKISGHVQNVLLSTTAGAYFSYDGGAENGADGAVYNTLVNGEDFADFVTASCSSGQYTAYVQNDDGCPGVSVGITTDGPGGTNGPEITILNAIGYDEIAPEPATFAMLGSGIAVLAWIGWRRRHRVRASID